MFNTKYCRFFRSVWVASALSLSGACASTTLEVPPETAATPDAATMPVASATPALKDDFDPWATAPVNSGHEGHDGHEAAPSSAEHEEHQHD